MAVFMGDSLYEHDPTGDELDIVGVSETEVIADFSGLFPAEFAAVHGSAFRGGMAQAPKPTDFRTVRPEVR
jgi:hypothetical protein